MTKRIGFVLLGLSLVLFCAKKSTGPDDSKTPQDLIDRIDALTGVTVMEISPTPGFQRTFQIDIMQPLDHDVSDGLQFSQRLYLNHTGETRPLVFGPSGYGATAARVFELTPLLNANQIYVTHRFFPEAMPVPADWRQCTIWQAANDHHRIVELFKTIYPGKWISTGRSKNGMTAFFHRRYFPDDVDATVAYVAPLPLDTADVRFDQFLGTVSTPENREKISNFQRAVLKKRGEIIPMVRNTIDGQGLTCSVGAGGALEYAVCEYPFAFWQSGPGDCSEIPDTNATAAVLYQHLELRSGTLLFTDQYSAYYAPLWYQAYTQFGYYRLIFEHLADLMESVAHPSYGRFVPAGYALDFDPQISQDILNWIQTEGNNMIFIYGGQDPWSAAAITLTGQTNALKFVHPGGNHSVRIADLAEQQTVYNTLEQWLGLSVDVTKAGLGQDSCWETPWYERPFEPHKSAM